MFNLAINRAKEAGVVDLWISDWLDNFSQSQEYVCSAVKADSLESMGFADVEVVFLVMLLGVCGGLFVLVCEKLLLKLSA